MCVYTLARSTFNVKEMFMYMYSSTNWTNNPTKYFSTTPGKEQCTTHLFMRQLSCIKYKNFEYAPSLIMYNFTLLEFLGHCQNKAELYSAS